MIGWYFKSLQHGCPNRFRAWFFLTCICTLSRNQVHVVPNLWRKMDLCVERNWVDCCVYWKGIWGCEGVECSLWDGIRVNKSIWTSITCYSLAEAQVWWPTMASMCDCEADGSSSVPVIFSFLLARDATSKEIVMYDRYIPWYKSQIS